MHAPLDDRDPAGKLEPGTIVGEHYELERGIASGGMGFVYRAHDTRTQKPVAIKVMRGHLRADKNAVKRFQREAKTVAELAHPNIIEIFDYGFDSNDMLYIAMEWLDGKDLGQILESEGTLAPARAAYLIAEVGKSLEEAHAKNIIHRDLKPENVIVLDTTEGGSEKIKVLDFGIAKMVKSDAQTQLTMMGTICGTPEYMSPEQALGKELDGRSDVYALGCMLYTLLVGDEPFVGKIPLNVVMQHLNQEFPRLPPNIPSGMANIIYTSTEKERDDRYKDIHAFAEVLDEFVIVDEVRRSVSHELSQLQALAAEEGAATTVAMPAWKTPDQGTPKLVLASEDKPAPPASARPRIPQEARPAGTPSNRNVPQTANIQVTESSSMRLVLILSLAALVVVLVVLILWMLM